jgi:hypothetical protein
MRDQLQALRDGVAVNGSGGDDLEDEQVERALRKIGLVDQVTPLASTYSALRVEDQGMPHVVSDFSWTARFRVSSRAHRE